MQEEQHECDIEEADHFDCLFVEFCLHFILTVRWKQNRCFRQIWLFDSASIFSASLGAKHQRREACGSPRNSMYTIFFCLAYAQPPEACRHEV